jgi:hypothetical protein
MPQSKKGRGTKTKAPPAESNGHDNGSIVNFKMSSAQHAAGSAKSGKGRVFNLSLYFKLLHAQFVDEPLEVSQAKMAQLLKKYGKQVGVEG